MFLFMVAFIYAGHFVADHSHYPIDCHKNPAFTCQYKVNE